MAATHLTLEEAAERLGISPEQFKKRLKTDTAFKGLVPIRDGSTLRFKSAAIDELARELGEASNPELPLGPMAGGLPPDSDDFKVPAVSRSDANRETTRRDDQDILSLSNSGEDIFSLTADDSKSGPKKGPKKESDSDVRLEPGKAKKPGHRENDASVVPTEELAIDFGGSGIAIIKGGSSSKLSAPKSSGKLSSGKSPRPMPRRTSPTPGVATAASSS